MVESKQDKIFNTKVIPIMNKVRNDLQNKLADELRSNSNSFAGLMAAAAGPDGGMASMQAQNDTLKYTGKWTSKTTEDYIAMVKKELKRQHITVNASMEQKMIDKMIKDKIQKSSIDYIIRKAATSTIFYLPQEVAKSPLEQKIDSEAEKRYKPSVWEKNAGIALGSVTDLACMGGLGGGLKTAATWIGSDMLVTHVGDKLNDRSDVPMIIAPGKEDEYRRTQQEKKKQAEQKPQNKPQSEEAQQAEPTEEVNQSEGEASNTQPEQTNMNGWQGLLTSFGLNGISDIGHNLGYVLAMLPDMIIGMFTGKTPNLKLQDNLMPLAAIVGGMFVKSPLLKLLLIGFGGANILNKAGHAAISDGLAKSNNVAKTYKVYPDEPLNSRIVNPAMKGSSMIATIDGVPSVINISRDAADAYNKGAIPINTLANAVLRKYDENKALASQNYEQHLSQEETTTQSMGIK